MEVFKQGTFEQTVAPNTLPVSVHKLHVDGVETFHGHRRGPGDNEAGR